MAYSSKSLPCEIRVYSEIVILEDIVSKQEYNGIASWYYNRGEMTAAMNQFEMGDKVKVTNKGNEKNLSS